MQNHRDAFQQEKTAHIRSILKTLPSACSDFISSITMTTSVLTRLAYTIDLKAFCTYASQEVVSLSGKPCYSWTDDDLAAFTSRDFLRYSEYLTLYYKDILLDDDDGREPQQMIIQNHEYGVMRKLSTLRSFFEYLFINERIPGNQAVKVPLPKLHQKPILYLIGPEIEQMLNTVSTGEGLTDRQKAFQKATQKRDYAMLLLFLGTGMRVSECTGINYEDFDFESNGVLVQRKGGNQVVLYYPDEVSQALQDYWEERRMIQTADDDTHAFFLSLQRKRISQRAVQLMVKKYCAIAAPLKKKMSPHKLRSTYATRLYDETKDIYLVAESLGHADVNTTRRHYAAMSDQRRREAAQNVRLPVHHEVEMQIQSPIGETSPDEPADSAVDISRLEMQIETGSHYDEDSPGKPETARRHRTRRLSHSAAQENGSDDAE